MSPDRLRRVLERRRFFSVTSYTQLDLRRTKRRLRKSTPVTRWSFRLLEHLPSRLRFLFPGSSVDYRLEVTKRACDECIALSTGLFPVESCLPCTHNQSVGSFDLEDFTYTYVAKSASL